ncbi:MAG: lysylphosphatidylglycerol synthase domain-containing protein, partial [Pseudomonadota bacterium]
DDLRQLDWAAVSQAVRAVSLADLAIALLLTAVSYYAMAMYDGVALRILGYRLRGRLSLRAGFAATSLGQTLGFGVLVGTAVRWRFYRGTGISATTSGLVTGVVSTGFFIALILLVSACIAFGSFDFSEMTGLSPAMLQTAALAILAGGALLFAIAYLQPRIRLAGRTLPLPRFQPLVRISALAVLDIVPAAAALWMLLPADVAPTFTQLLPIYAVALGLALVSNTPGGLGVLEFACLLAWPLAPAESIIAALILYRVVYYGAPFLLGLAFLADHESRRKGKGQSRAVWQHGAEESDAALLSKAHRAEANLIQQGDKRVAGIAVHQARLPTGGPEKALVSL